MKRYLLSVMPSATTWVGLFILPSVLSVYFVLTSYSDQFIETQGVDYVAVQNNILAKLYLGGSFGDFMTRFMDFAFWGVVAAIVIVIGWSIGVARTSFGNKRSQDQFVKYNNTESWHSHFAVALVAKLLIVFLILFFFYQLLSKALPQLATGIARSVQELTVSNVGAVVLGVLIIVFLQFLMVYFFKLFRITQLD
jgi:hypothetical protein